jgi:cysteine desulfurase
MDYHATTPVDPRVFEVMKPYFTELFGNPASTHHSFGWRAEDAVERARKQVAELINADPKEIIFTSGASESNNLALKGIEHKSILDSFKRLEKSGVRVTYLPVNPDGQVDLEKLKAAIADDTVLISVMYANNEIGAVQNMREIGRIAHERGVYVHTDAAQAVAKVPVDVVADNIDLMSLTGHKIYGPKGAGALYIKKKIQITPQIDGGGHERGLRSGTLNVPCIAGLGEACAIAKAEMAEEAKRVGALRDRLKDTLLASLDQVHINGGMERRLPNNLNVSFEHVESNALMTGINDIAVSSGSACSSAAITPSHVLRAIGLSDERAHYAIRFGLGRYTTQEEVNYVAGRVIDVVKKLRELSPILT